MVEANWNGYLGFGYVPRRAIGAQQASERAEQEAAKGKSNGSERSARRSVEQAELASVDATALTLELDRTRAELEASRKRLLDADRAADETGELRRRLSSALKEKRALSSDLLVSRMSLLEADRAANEVGELRRRLASALKERRALSSDLLVSRMSLLEADRAANEVGELRRRLASALKETRAMRGYPERVQRLEARLAASEQSEMHLQRYCDRLEARLADARAESARLRIR